MNTVFALAGVVIKEMYRRKDFYVLFVLTALLRVGSQNDEDRLRAAGDVQSRASAAGAQLRRAEPGSSQRAR